MQLSENPGELLNPETGSLNEVLTNLSGLLTQRITTFHTGDRLCRGSLRPSNGWLTRLRVHALRPVPVDAGNKAQISGNRILATILVNRVGDQTDCSYVEVSISSGLESLFFHGLSSGNLPVYVRF